MNRIVKILEKFLTIYFTDNKTFIFKEGDEGDINKKRNINSNVFYIITLLLHPISFSPQNMRKTDNDFLKC